MVDFVMDVNHFCYDPDNCSFNSESCKTTDKRMRSALVTADCCNFKSNELKSDTCDTMYLVL